MLCVNVVGTSLWTRAQHCMVTCPIGPVHFCHVLCGSLTTCDLFFLMNVISNCAYVNMPKYINIVVGCTHAEGRLWWLHYISLKSELVDLKNLN